MKKLLLLVSISLLDTGCATVNTLNAQPSFEAVNSKSQSIVQNAPSVPPIPKWITSTPSNKSIGCAQIKNGNIVMAKQVSLAKAKAEFLSIKNTEVEVITEVKESTSTENGSTSHNSSISNDIRLKANGFVDHHQKIYQQEEVVIDNKPHLCVLFG